MGVGDKRRILVAGTGFLAISSIVHFPCFLIFFGAATLISSTTVAVICGIERGVLLTVVSFFLECLVVD